MFGNARRVFLVVLLLAVGSVEGQNGVTRSNLTLQLQQVDSMKQFNEDFIKSREEYNLSLQKLLVEYESDVQKLTERSAKWKELLAEGIVSRKEYETTISSLARAQVRVEETRKQIMSTETTIAEARRQPQLDELQNSEVEGSPPDAPPWTTGNSRIDNLIRQNAARYGVDAYFIYCVIQQESDFSPTAVSVKGARGLMQLMPGTAARYGVIDVNDPAQNIMGGTRYLKDLLRLFPGRIDLVLAAYNAGEGAVIKYGQTVPPYKETKDYVRLISLRYLRRPMAQPR
jgi:soluble lytic murein transglycosylase-like protein